MYLIYCVLLLFSPSNMSSTARACSLWFTSICLISRANPLPDPQFPSVGHTCPCKAQPQRVCLGGPGQGYCSITGRGGSHPPGSSLDRGPHGEPLPLLKPCSFRGRIFEPSLERGMGAILPSLLVDSRPANILILDKT